MSKLLCECERCKFQPVFEDKEQTHFKCFQCTECGYIMTGDDIKRTLIIGGLYGEFCELIDFAITCYEKYPSDYIEGYVSGMIRAAHGLNIIDDEQKSSLLNRAGLDPNIRKVDS